MGVVESYFDRKPKGRDAINTPYDFLNPLALIVETISNGDPSEF